MLTIYFSWAYWRIAFLVATLGGCVCTLGIVIAAPEVEKRSVEPFEFPAHVPLPEWKFVKSTSIPRTSERSDLVHAYKYDYQQNQILLEIQMKYLVNVEGNVSRLLNLYTPVKSTIGLTESHQEEVGFYGKVQDNGRIYLTACINPRGSSTLTQQQFMQNRYSHDLLPSRLFFWLLGQQDFWDLRCMLTLISIPEQQDSSIPEQDVFEVLESVWFSWYSWWQPRFPKS